MEKVMTISESQLEHIIASAVRSAIAEYKEVSAGASVNTNVDTSAGINLKPLLTVVPPRDTAQEVNARPSVNTIVATNAVQANTAPTVPNNEGVIYLEEGAAVPPKLFGVKLAVRKRLAYGYDPLILASVTAEDISDYNYFKDVFKDNNYKTTFNTFVTKVVSLDPLPEQAKRNLIVNNLCESYMNQVYDMPNSKQLELLGNFIMAEVMRDTRPDKVTLTEHPFLNDRQLDLRMNREMTTEGSMIEFHSAKNTSGIAKKKYSQEFKG